MSEPTVVLEPVVVRGRARRDRGVPAPAPALTNRAGALARAAAEAPSPGGEARFGGFRYERTAEDEAQVAVSTAPVRDRPAGREVAAPDMAAREAAAREAAADTAPEAAGAVDRFGGFAYERTAQDEAEAAAHARAGSAAAVEAAPGRDTGVSDAPAGGGADAGEVPEEAVTAAAATTGPTPPRGAGAPAGAAPAAGAGGPPPGSIGTPEELVAGMRTAADALPRPEVEPAPLAARLEPRVAAARARAGRRRSGGGARRRPPAPPLTPIEIDPVPEATATLSTAINARLPELSLPPAARMPDGTVPEVRRPGSVSREDLSEEVPVTDPAPASEEANATERRRVEAAVAEAATPTVVTVPDAVPVDPPVLLDVRPPPPPELPPAQAALEQSQLTRVLAIVLEGVDHSAADIVQRVRDQAFPPDKMGSSFTELTDPLVTEVRAGLRERFEALGVAAGLGVEELAEAVNQRHTELLDGVAHVASEAELVVDRAAEELTEAAAGENARIAGEERAAEARRVQRLRLALHSRDPAVVEELVATRLKFIGQDVARAVVAIEAAGTRRAEQLRDYAAAYRDAYRRADDAFQQRLPADQRRPPAVGDRLWIDIANDQLDDAFRNLQGTTTHQVEISREGVVAAGLQARAAVRAWADGRLRRTLTEEEARARTETDAATQRGEIAAARADAEQAAVRGRLLGEIRFAAGAYVQAQDEARGECVDRAMHLDRTQLDVARRYLAAGTPDDPLSAVAAQQVARYAQDDEERHGRAAALRAEVLGKDPQSREEAIELGDIYFPRGSGELLRRVQQLHAAFEVWHGTAEEDAISALEGVTGPPMRLLNATYRLQYDESLRSRIDDELSGSDFDQAYGLAGDDGSDSAEAVAARQRHARGVIADSDGWFSNDPDRALDAIRALPPGEAQAVVDDDETAEHLSEVLGGRRFVEGRSVADDRGRRELDILVEINSIGREPGAAPDPRIRDLQARADAIELDRAVRHGTGGAPELDRVFDRIRASVVADSATSAWSAVEIDNEVRRRASAMELAYETQFGAELPSGGMSALRTAMARHLWGTRRDLAVALLDVNRAGERAVRLQRTTEGLYTSDSEMNTELDRTYRDALAEVRRADSYRSQVEERAQALMAADGVGTGGRRPAPREVEAYRREATEALARELAQEWMTDVRREFGERYARRWGGDSAGALRSMVEATTQWGGEDEALDRLAGGGGLTTAQAVEHGVAGWGMEADPVLGALEGRTVQQLARISDEYSRNTDGEDMVERLRSETGGWTQDTADTLLERDAFDLREALRGVPLTPQEERDAARRRFEYERDVYFRNQPHVRDAEVGEELALMRRAFERTDARYRAYEAAVASGDERAVRRAEVAVRQGHDATTVLADHYRTAVDAYVDRAAQVAGIAAAVTVAVAVTVLSGGAAAPAVVALAASLAGTAATIATKQDVLGSAYSSHQLTNDVIVGVVDAVVSVLTARLGNILLRLPRPTGATQAALRASMRAVEAQRLARPVLTRAAATAAEQVAGAVPSAVTGAMLDRGTWRGDPLRNVLTSAGMAAVVSVGVGTAVHGAPTYGPRVLGGAVDAIRGLRRGSGAELAPDSVLLRSASDALAAGERGGDVLTRTGTPTERLAAQREYLRRFPGRTAADFRRAVAEGTADAHASAQAVHELGREMRRHLLEGIPPAERGAFVDTPILVLSDAEFTARTGSRSRGRAVTLVVDGEPVVVVREGAPLSILREEGMHVRQVRDVLNAERVRLLDERRLAEWATTSLEDRVAAWDAKLDLELEVQTRLVADLEAELSTPGLGARRAADLMDRLADARAALDVLGERRTVLDGLDPATLRRMDAGDVDPPHFLVDEPRLFTKAADEVAEEAPAVRPPHAFHGDMLYFVEDGELYRYGVPQGRPGERFFERFGGALPDHVDSPAALRTFLDAEGTLAPRSWRRTGSAGREVGAVGEFAMVFEHQRRMGVDEHGVTRVQLDAQVPGRGHGFDDVVIEFRATPDGGVRAWISVFEAKYYRGSVADLSAVSKNFVKNLDRVRQRLTGLLAELDAPGGPSVAGGMTRAQVLASIEAVDDRQLDVVVRMGPETRISDARLRAARQAIRSKIGTDVAVRRGDTIGDELFDDAILAFLTHERYRTAGDASLEQFRLLATGPRGVSPESVQVADVVMRALEEPGSVISGPVRWSAVEGVLVDGQGNPFRVASVPLSGAPFDPVDAARQVLRMAEARAPGPGGADVPLRVVVDFFALSPGEAVALKLALRDVALQEGLQGAFRRTMLFTSDVWRLTVEGEL